MRITFSAIGDAPSSSWLGWPSLCKAKATRLFYLFPLIVAIAGCAPAPSDSAICDTLGEAIRDHARALSHPSTPDDAVTTGARLIRGIDAGCK